ncbi:MAG TPA: YbhB/YbcL family Raf kinase inhibitor-like protein [Clostridiaceae bacterium]|nr:YbhB/YbcL family Raf kinase inhibitor-like protein [Clostridiaceae bacterium]
MKQRTIALLLMILLVLASACAASGKTQPSESPDVSQSESIPHETSGTTTPEPLSTPEPESTVESTPEPTPEPTSESTPMPDMTIASAGIVSGAMKPEYGAKGKQFVKGKIPSLSLPLTVNHIPKGTEVLSITMIDPDGGDWVHWLAVNIPVDGETCEILENSSIDWPEEIIQGKNDFGTVGYGGPTPPSGTHTYIITVYALSETLDLKAGFKLAAMQKAMKGKVLAEAVVTGTYAK